MSDAARAPFLCTLLCPLPSGPLGLDEKPAYIRERSSEKGHRARFSIKVKVYRKGWHRGAFDYRTFLGDYDTWEDAVKDMPLQREKKEKETRSETRAPTATVPPRSTSKRKQIDWDEVIRAEAIAEEQRLALVQEPDAHADSDDGFVAPPADDDDDEDTPPEPGPPPPRPRQPARKLNQPEPQVYKAPPMAVTTSLRGKKLLPHLEKLTTHGLNRNIVHFAYAFFFGKNIENEIKEETARKFENTVQSVRITPQGDTEIKDVMEACRGAREVGEEKLQEAVSKIKHLEGHICVLYVFGSARKSSNLKDDKWAYKGKGWVVRIRVEIKLSRRVSNTAES